MRDVKVGDPVVNRVTYRRLGEGWLGVVVRCGFVFGSCGHQHLLRSKSTVVGGLSAEACVRVVMKSWGLTEND